MKAVTAKFPLDAHKATNVLRENMFRLYGGREALLAKLSSPFLAATSMTSTCLAALLLSTSLICGALMCLLATTVFLLEAPKTLVCAANQSF